MKRTPVSDATNMDRRHFLKMAGGSGLVLGLQLPLAGCGREEAAPSASKAYESSPTPFAPNAFIRISSDNTVTLIIKHFEMGQGATTGLATLLADEMDADLAQVVTEYAPANAALYGNKLLGGAQGTGGSTAIADSWQPMREAGAAARAMLVRAAAQEWGVGTQEIQVSAGVVHFGKHRATFGELADAAGKLSPPEELTLKTPDHFNYIGKAGTRRVDSRPKCDGTAVYTIDVKKEGLLTAVIARPPAFGAKLNSVDATAAKAVKGVVAVVTVPQGVAVVAEGMWPAMQGRKALKLDWDETAAGPKSSAALYDEYTALAATPGQEVVASEKTGAGLANADKLIDATYEFPYLAHAPMEPMNCVAWLHDGQLETWGGHQFPSIDLPTAAAVSGLPEDKIQLNTLIAGGSFGRRANPAADFTAAAVSIARALKEEYDLELPVRVQWTREDDTQGGFYRPLYVHRSKIGLDKKGGIQGWKHTVVGQGIMLSAGFLPPGTPDHSSFEGIHPSPYAIPAMSLDLHSTEQPVPPLWWRSVGHTHTGYVMETLMDEMATAAGQDAVAFRLNLLKDAPRAAAVLKLAADKAGWGSDKLAKGRALGIAMHKSFESYVAQVAEVSLMEDGLPKVHKVTCAIDCGVAVNPDQIAAQMEGGIGFALAAMLYSEVEIENGRPKQSNFHDYRSLRINQMPAVDVHIVASDQAPTGVGEPGVPPLAPAVANAMFQLTGERIRKLPLSRA